MTLVFYFPYTNRLATVDEFMLALIYPKEVFYDNQHGWGHYIGVL